MLTRLCGSIRFRSSRFSIGDIEIEKRVFLVHGENTVVVEYEMKGGVHARWTIRPLIAFRDYHSLTQRNSALNADIITLEGCVQFTPYAGLPTLYTSHNGVAVELRATGITTSSTTRNASEVSIFKKICSIRFMLRFQLRSGEIARLVASTRPVDVAEVPAMRAREIARRRAVVAASPSYR